MSVSDPGLFDLTGKVALITGGGGGLGRAFAEGLSMYGARVICADRDRDGAEASAGILRQRGGDAHALTVDVADPPAVEAMAAQVKAQFARVDILINNAGIATLPYRTHEL